MFPEHAHPDLVARMVEDWLLSLTADEPTLVEADTDQLIAVYADHDGHPRGMKLRECIVWLYDGRQLKVAID